MLRLLSRMHLSPTSSPNIGVVDVHQAAVEGKVRGTRRPGKIYLPALSSYHVDPNVRRRIHIFPKAPHTFN